MADNEKCATSACHCEVQAGERYCSPHCEQQGPQQDASASDGSAQCGCGHPACRHD